MSGFSRKLIQEIHQIVNKQNKRPLPLTPEMEKRVRELAAELADKYTNVKQEKVEAILTKMAMEGDDLDDLEALEQELRTLGTN